MSSDTPKPPEGFNELAAPESNDDDYDTEWVDKPEYGDMVQGILLNRNPDRGDYDTDVLELKLTGSYEDFDEGDLVCFWSTDGIDNTLDSNEIERGTEIAIACDSTWETDDGETRNNYSVYSAN